ncbi:MAG: proline dehydrogenase family protein [Sediminibacterium sp.]|nr:proline dehydrogenase family protein [Sediminibacterium sp.]
MISFDNTEIAFQSKSKADLNRSYWLFKLISNPGLVKMGAQMAPLALNLGFKGLFKRTIFKQFVGGEDIADCERTIQELGKFRIGTILDYSVEGKESEADFNHCVEETLQTIAKAKGNPHIPFCVFKVTGLARFDLLVNVSAGKGLSAQEQNEWDTVKDRVAKICKAAHEAKQPVFIDAEESWIQPAIDELANTNMERFNRESVIVYNTYQLYRHDRVAYLQQTLETATAKGFKVGAKLVRGAYMEKERLRAVEMNYASPINATKADSDRDYDAALNVCMAHIDRMAICAGTHNEKSSLLLTQLMEQKGLAHNDTRVYFSQLLGMSDHISYNLAKAGYNVVKYVPYGPIKEVMPYLIRRAQENTSVKGQTGRELSLIIKEKTRRKKG